MKERIKQFEASVNVSFDVSFTVLTTSEEQARVKIDNLLEIMRDEATVDCHIHPSYDVSVDECNVETNYISEY